jgi:hypothetical protein
VEGEKEMFVKACMHACFLPTYLTTTPSLLACVISPFEMHNPQRSVSLPTVRNLTTYSSKGKFHTTARKCRGITRVPI